MRRLAIVSLAMALPFGSGCRPQAEPAPEPRALRFSTGTPGGGFRPIGAALARAFRKAAAPVVLEPIDSAGSISNVLALQDGSADIGLAVADVTYMAVRARLPAVGERLDRLRGIAVLQLTPLQLVVAPRSTIRDIADLRGRRVSFGPAGGGTALSATLVLEALGVPAAGVRSELMLFNDAARRVLDGTLDAMFVNGSYPAESVRVALQGGARLVPISSIQGQRVRQEHPFFRLALVPAGAYPGQVDPVPTVGIDTLLLCRVDLDDEAAYVVAKTLFQVLPSVVVEQPALRSIDLDQLSATPIPLHPGAARYYREREIER